MNDFPTMVLEPILPPSALANLRVSTSGRMMPDLYATGLQEAMQVALVESMAKLPPPQNWKEMSSAFQIWDKLAGFSEARTHKLRKELIKEVESGGTAGLVNVTPTIRRAPAPVDLPTDPAPELPAFD